MPKPRLLVVTGPTASGKSALALELAEALGGEIVSADSMQVYRHLDIGTAKPTATERRRAPHHLIDVADPDETYHAGRFRTEAARAVEDILSRGGAAIVVGGTALYLKVLLEGLAAAPGRSEAVRLDLEARWEAGEGPGLWEELSRVDPVLVLRLHPNDRARIIRGLEVWRSAGRPLSAAQEEHRFGERPYDALILGLEVPRSLLHRRIDDRVAQMIRAGWAEEVQQLLRMGYGPDLPPLQAIGYRQLCAWLRDGGDLAPVVEDIRAETRRFAKRQMTWFRRMDVRWLAPDDATGAARLARNFLQRNSRPI